MHFRARIAGRTDTGRVRDHNEDVFMLVDLDSGSRGDGAAVWSIGDRGVLLAVSDGIGGAAAGEVASALSVDSLLRELQRDDGDGSVSSRLERVVTRASRSVADAAQGSHRGMGATLTVALLSGADVFLAQIGDSRGYLLRDGALRQITKDQSYVQQLVDEGRLSHAEAERSPDKNIIMQAMGQLLDPYVGLGHLALRAGDRLLLCSDGLTNAVSHGEIASLAAGDDLARACASLIDAANEAGGPDNITVVLAAIERA